MGGQGTDRSVHFLLRSLPRPGMGGIMDLVVESRPAAEGEGLLAPASPRERLIEAATRLFCRYGVNSVGVDAIVEAAGTAQTTLHPVFRSEGGLVGAGGGFG